MVPVCGIAGMSLSRDENIEARDLAVALLLGIEERGRHATGAAFFENGQPFVQKTDMAASEFVEYLDMAPGVTNAILHTRWASQGSPKINANNHPIDVNGIIGVHNGVLYNDDALFRRLTDLTGEDKRLAEVDSEAIFATLLHSREKTVASLARVEGSAAIAWIESYGDPDLLHVSRISSSPLVFAYSEAGSFVFASTAHALTNAMNKVGMTLAGGPYNLEEGIYLRVRHGEIVTRMRFEAADRAFDLSLTEKKALNLI